MPDPQNLSDEEIYQKLLDLWRRYVVLTEELLKFINKKDVDTFMELVRQRGVLIEQMKQFPDKKFRETDVCKQMIEKIVPIDREVAFKARAWLIASKRQNASVKAYDTYGGTRSSGRIFNRKF